MRTLHKVLTPGSGVLFFISWLQTRPSKICNADTELQTATSPKPGTSLQWISPMERVQVPHVIRNQHLRRSHAEIIAWWCNSTREPGMSHSNILILDGYIKTFEGLNVFLSSLRLSCLRGCLSTHLQLTQQCRMSLAGAGDARDTQKIVRILHWALLALTENTQ